MFEFLETSEIVHLVHEFMHKWHKIDEQEELLRKRRNRTFDVRMKDLREKMDDEIEERREQLRNKYKEDLEQAAKAQDEPGRVARLSPTVEDMSATMGIDKNRIKQAIREAEKKAEIEFVRFSPNPEEPDLAHLALREHAEKLGLQNWQPGSGF